MSPRIGPSQGLEGKLRSKPGRTGTAPIQRAGDSKQEGEPTARPRQKEH